MIRRSLVGRVDCFVNNKSFAYHRSPRPIAFWASLGSVSTPRDLTHSLLMTHKLCSMMHVRSWGVPSACALPWRKHGGLDGRLLLLANIIAWNHFSRAQTRMCSYSTSPRCLHGSKSPVERPVVRNPEEGCISHVPNSTRIKVHGAGVLEGPCSCCCCYYYS